MFRIVFQSSAGNVYLSNRPGYWNHWALDAECCVPFETEEEANKILEWNNKHCGDVIKGTGEIENYEETRELVKHKSNGNLVAKRHMPYYSDRCMYKELAAK